MSHTLKTGHPKNGKHSQYVAIVNVKDLPKAYIYSLPEYGDNQCVKLQDFVLSTYFYDTTISIIILELSPTKDTTFCYYDFKKRQWQLYTGTFKKEVSIARPTTNQTAKSSLVMWIPLKPEYRKQYTGHNLYSVDVDEETGEMSDHISAESLKMQYKRGGWDDKANGEPLVYRNDGRKKAVAYYSRKYDKILYHQTLREFGKPHKPSVNQSTEGVKKIENTLA